MDSAVSPCEDFYQYSCGGWARHHPTPEGKSQWSNLALLWQENQIIMKSVLEEEVEDTDSNAACKAKWFYQSCMDEDGLREKLSGEPLLILLHEIGSWSVCGQSVNSKDPWDLHDILQVVVGKYGLNAFFYLVVSVDEKNSSRNILQIEQGGLGLPNRQYYLNESYSKVLDAYIEYIASIGELMGGERNSSHLAASRLVELEKELASITVSPDEARERKEAYNLISLSDLQEQVGCFRWKEILDYIFSKTRDPWSTDEDIVLYSSSYFTNLTDIIDKYLSTEEGRIALNDYVLWQLIRVSSSFLSKEYRNAIIPLEEQLSGVGVSEAKWRFCVDDTDEVLGFALGAMFVEQEFQGAEKKSQAEMMINEIRSAFKKGLPSLNWLDNKTRNRALDKADAITDMIGFPEYIANHKQLDDYYKRLEINESSYFLNNMNYLEFFAQRIWQEINKAPNKTKWFMKPADVNAYYDASRNKIVFPAGILQTPFYDPHYPKALNFGGMGVVMGHEFTHAFDDQGKQYDKYGNLKGWWEDDAQEEFKKRSECMVDQYSNFSIGDVQVNGKLTLGENIADNGGLKLAYQAYKHWSSLYGDELILPGVNLTNSQLFFVGFAQVWCSQNTQKSEQALILSDTHTPNRFRVVGPITNSKEFSHDFDCPKKSNMNPVHKCEVW